MLRPQKKRKCWYRQFCRSIRSFVIADQNASAELVAIDMFAQAEHDETAQVFMTSVRS